MKLAGTLTLPRGKSAFPAVILITGSGAQNRNEEMLGHKPFLVLADYLTRQGVAVLRVDDRGVGGSTGSVSNSTSDNFGADVLAGIEFLKSRKEVNPKQIGLIGHSEGGLIAPMVAAQSNDVAFIVLLAGPGLPGEEILYLQGADSQSKRRGRRSPGKAPRDARDDIHHPEAGERQRRGGEETARGVRQTGGKRERSREDRSQTSCGSPDQTGLVTLVSLLFNL